MIRVTLLQDIEGVGVRGQSVEIEEASFDEKLHLKVVEQAAVPRTIGEMEPEAFTASIATSVGTALQSALEAAGVGRVDETRIVARPGETRVPAMAAGRVTPTWEYLYRSLPDWEREVRTPESDYDIAQYFKAQVARDSAGMRTICEKYNSREGESDWERAALAEGADPTGGFLVPTPMSTVIIAKRSQIEVIGPRAAQYSSANQVLEVPTEAVLMTALGFAEAATITEQSATFGQVVFTKKKSAAATRSSRELLDDNPFNLVSLISDQAARAFAVYNDAQDAVDGDGTGTNQTDALDDNSSIGVIDATVGTLVYNDISAIFYGLLSQYRAFASWIMDNTIIKICAELLDTNGRPIFVGANEAATPLTGGQGAPGVGTILGRPVLESTGMPNVGAAPAGVIIFGDLSRYGVLNDGAIRVESSDQVAFLEDQIVWKFVQRRDGAVLQAEAFKKSIGITA